MVFKVTPSGLEEECPFASTPAVVGECKQDASITRIGKKDEVVLSKAGTFRYAVVSAKSGSFMCLGRAALTALGGFNVTFWRALVCILR